MKDTTVPKLNLTAEWGPEDPKVETIWQLLKDAASRLEDEKIKVEAEFRADRIYEKLNEARNHYKSIRTQEFLSRPTSEQDAIYNALYSSLWSAYKNRLISFLSTIGYEAGAIVSGENQYDSQMAAFEKRYPELDWLKQLIDGQKQNWQDNLRDNRNAQEHDGDLRDKQDLHNLNELIEASRMFAYVSRAIESIAICLISYKLPKYWNVVHLNKQATVFSEDPRFVVEHPFITSQRQS